MVDITAADAAPAEAGSTPSTAATRAKSASEMTSQLERAQDALWGQRDHIGERIEATGALRWEAVKDAYIEGKGPVSTLRLFKNGVFMAARHPTVNARKNKSAVKRFAIRILERGYMEDHRSAPMWITSEDDPDTPWMVAAGTISMAIKMAWELQPNNRYIIKIMNEGIPNTLKFVAGTPLDVLRYAKTENNQYHDGCELSVQEMYQEVPSRLAAWQAYRAENRITVAGCPKTGDLRYEKRYEQFVMGFEDNPFKTWDQFKCCAAFFNMMTQDDLYTVYSAKLGDFQDVLCPTKMELVATHNHLMLMTMKKFEL